jgi:hypothetical protein
MEKFTTVSELIAYYKSELLLLKPRERAEKLLRIMQSEKERCNSMNFMEAGSSTVAMVQFMKDTKLSQELQAAIISLSEFLSTGHIERYYLIDGKPKLCDEIIEIIGVE